MSIIFKTLYRGSLRKLIPLSLSILSIVSCSEDVKKEAAPSVKVVLPEPFHYHKAVEVKPGLTFDVLSWGRGSELQSAFLILRSDSANIKYRSASGELEGRIEDVWNMDMDADGNPEIFIQTKGDGKETYFGMYVYEFDDEGSSRELRFPDLRAATRKTYRGRDSVYVKEGALFREFPVYDESDTAGVKPTGKKIIEYKLNGSSFSVEDRSPEQ